MTKDATVSARIDETLKAEAESILQQLGIPVSVVINTLYHQIVIQHGGVCGAESEIGKGSVFRITLNTTLIG